MRFFIDTSIFVDVLRSDIVEPSKNFLESIENNNNGFSSVITTAELSVGANRSPRKNSISKTLDILSIVHLVDVNRDIDLESGRIYADLIKKGKEIELNDCIIAASSLSVGIEKIITRNKEHFNRIEGIVAFEPEEIGF